MDAEGSSWTAEWVVSQPGSGFCLCTQLPTPPPNTHVCTYIDITAVEAQAGTDHLSLLCLTSWPLCGPGDTILLLEDPVFLGLWVFGVGNPWSVRKELQHYPPGCLGLFNQ